MNKDQITAWAREAGGLPDPMVFIGAYERFAALVAAAAKAEENEACAKVCEAEANRAKWNWDNDISGNQPFWNGGEQLASNCAAAIRSRKENT